jgi:hypothetical protein
MKKIGINCSNLVSVAPAGIERYSLEVIKNLIKFAPAEFLFILYFDREPTGELLKSIYSNRSNVQSKVISSFISWTQFGLLFHLLLNPVE